MKGYAMAKHDNRIRSADNDDATSPVSGTGLDEIAPRDWKLKHMDPRAIEAARAAAKANGLRLGAWVARAIQSVALKELAAAPGAKISLTPNAEAKEIYDRLVSIENHITHSTKENASRIDSLQNDIKVITHGLLPQIQDKVR